MFCSVNVGYSADFLSSQYIYSYSIVFLVLVLVRDIILYLSDWRNTGYQESLSQYSSQYIHNTEFYLQNAPLITSWSGLIESTVTEE